MPKPRFLVAVAMLLALQALFPLAAASEMGVARTTEGGCVLVRWTSQPYVVSDATGCSVADPCVEVNWTTTPPQAGMGEC